VVPGKISKRVIADRLGWVDKMMNEICASHLGDAEKIANALRSWLANNPSIMDETL
jgi:hypothetical protein